MPWGQLADGRQRVPAEPPRIGRRPSRRPGSARPNARRPGLISRTRCLLPLWRHVLAASPSRGCRRPPPRGAGRIGRRPLPRGVRCGRRCRPAEWGRSHPTGVGHGRRGGSDQGGRGRCAWPHGRTRPGLGDAGAGCRRRAARYGPHEGAAQAARPPAAARSLRPASGLARRQAGQPQAAATLACPEPRACSRSALDVGHDDASERQGGPEEDPCEERHVTHSLPGARRCGLKRLTHYRA